PLQRLLDLLGLVSLVVVDPETKGDVVEYAGRKRIGLLKHHSDVTPHRHRIDSRIVNVFPPIFHVAVKAKATDEIVHAVQAAQYGALAASGRSDESRD